MKNKPARHKETNTFQFKPFSERITEIDIDVFHRVAHRNEDYDEVETHFHQTLQKWNVLNLTEGFFEFRKKVREIITLPQLLNRKHYVVDNLLEGLSKKDSLFLQPILELVVALARDLQKEFYEYFPQFLKIIIDLLQTKDTEQLEYTFTTLAYLFKFLWRYLIRNIDTIFDLLLPLLSDTQPAFINNFAAESFAFVVRKVKDKNAFLKLIVRNLEKNTDGVTGCGKLLFEVIAGTPGQFHSCAEQMLVVYLGALRDESVNQKILYNVLKQITTCVIQAIHPHKCSILWTILLSELDEGMKIYKCNLEKEHNGRENSVCLILRLMHIIIEHKNGRMVIDPVLLIKKFVQITDLFKADAVTLKEVVNVSIDILLANNIKLLQEHSSLLVVKIMGLRNTELVHIAVEHLINYSSFESLVLPYMLKGTANINDATLLLLTKIINKKAPPCLAGINLCNWKKFVLDIRHFNMDSTHYFLQMIKSLSGNEITESALRLLVVIPHFKPLGEQLKNALTEAFVLLYQKVCDIESLKHTQPMQRLSLAFLLVLEALIHILEAEEINEFLMINHINIVDMITKHNDNILIINALDLFLTYFNQSVCHEQYVNLVTFNILHEYLAEKLSSPFHLIRLSVTHIYSLFKNIEGLTLSSEDNTKMAVELIYFAENVPITVHTYRDKLMHLESLAFYSINVSNLYPRYYDIPFRYIMGNLYVNFSLLWEPVSKLIASFADKEFMNFWPLFLSELKSTPTVDIEFHSNFECDVLAELEARMQKYDDKPDYVNQKVLLWKCMCHFSELCESKNRDLTTLFIDYVNTNFFKWNSEDAKSCSIKKRVEDDDVTTKEKIKDDEEEDASDVEMMNMDMEAVNNCTSKVVESSTSTDDGKSDDEEDDSKVTNAETREIIAFNRVQKVTLLLAQMELFAKVSNPRTLYREEEVHKIYLDLLSFKNPAIQKAALNCFFTYKHKYILPYKDYLNSLVDEKNLKHELTRFKIDKESNTIQEDHREGLMPVLMRIIYAKMAMKIGMRTGGKGGGVVRKKLILRFLAGTQEDEMLTFVNMAFKPFQKYMTFDKQMDLRAEVNNIINSLDLNNVVPPKRMQSAVNLLGIIIEQFGAKMEDNLLPCLLGIVLCILGNVMAILQRSAQVHTGYLTAIKNVRTNCIGILARFFSHFENYKWSKHEIDALFDVAVFPWLEKLPMDGINSPTALLKLFMAWSQNPRYFPLFLKYRDNDRTMTPLPYIVRLLLYPKTHASVTNAIMDMFEKMLTLQDYEKGDDSMIIDELFVPLKPILHNLLDIEEKYLAKGTNYGSVILLPHMSEILHYIEGRIKKSNKGVNKTELIILSRVSEFVNDPSLCDTLISLTLPILTKRAVGGDNEESVIEFLRTITNLIKHVKSPEVHLRSIAPLIGLISSVPARKCLLQLYHGIAIRCSGEHKATMLRNSEILSSLNAWDQKWIDQPDFQKRLDAFTEISAMSEKNEITLEFGVCIIYNCFYFVKNEGDLALKDCAGQCLKAIGPKLAKEHKANPIDRRYLLDDTILTIARKGIMSKTDSIRYQSIAFLGYMAMECADVHPILRDLSLLTNKADPEVDFFENMQHLQLHRRVRAMLRFCNIAKTLEKPMNPKTLTHFVLPLASSYLCNESHTNKNSIIDAAIEVVGTICRMLPWYHYEIILKYYLSKLRMSTDFQKQVVRIIVAILDNFHFDLSKYTGKEATLTPNVVSKEKELSAIGTETEDANLEEKLEEALTQEPKEKLEEAISGENAEEEIEKKISKTGEKNDIDNTMNNEAMAKFIALSANGAKRVISSISNGLLPQLHRAIAARTRHEDSHKVNRKKALVEHEEDDLVRVPIALAVVKLLQKLPAGILDANLPGIFMKLCTFLKSRLESVRRITREVLQKIMITLGPNYLHHLLKEMNALLTKGFQVHVLVYTVHAVLISLKPYFQKLHINNNLQSILSVCKVDLFGLTAEEKEIIGVTKNVSEAKSTRSFDIFHILAEYITESCLVDLILPLKEVLAKTNSHKTIQKIIDCLRNVALGLADNTYVPLEQMLIFLYGIVSESIPDLIPTKKDKKSKEEKNVANQQKIDCFIIPPEPKSRMGIKAVAKTTKNTNAHVMVEFGLKLYHILLKREKVASLEYKPFLEPFVPVLSDCLKSHRVKLSSLGLQCLNWMVKMDLTSMRESVSQISTSIFEILHKYAAAGLSKGDNFDLVMAAFKCMSVLIRDVKHFEISPEQLKILIMYAEQDLHDSDKQATAFTLLKSIIKRKLVVEEMYGVMDKIAQLSITSELEHVRVQSRAVFYSYLMQYPLGKHLEQHISFYLSQLSYEVQSGRLSALEMIHSMVTSFPQKTLCQQSGFMFVMLSARLVNDEDPLCRKLCAKCIKEMIERIRYNDKSKLFEITIRWLNDTNVAHRRLAAQLCGIFVTVENDGFESRLYDVIPVLLKQFHARFDDDDNPEPGRFVKIQPDNLEHRDKAYSRCIKDPERLKDHHMFQVLQLLLKISAHCTVFLKNEKYKEPVRLFAEHTQFLLAHPHLWVRLAATQYIGFVLSSLNIDKVTALLNNTGKCDPEEGYVYNKPVETIRSLALDLIGQLQPDVTFEELGDQVVKNLIFIARLVQPIKITGIESNGTKDVDSKTENISLPWLLKRMRKFVNVEVTQAPKSTFVRMAMFKWIAGVLATIPIEHLSGIIFNMMSPLVREMSTTEESNAPLRQLAKEVMGMIKKRMGTEEYSTMLNQVQRKHDVKKAERKKARTQQFVTDPELAAKRKIARQQKKKVARKRKLDSVRGKRAGSRKRPRKDVDMEGT